MRSHSSAWNRAHRIKLASFLSVILLILIALLTVENLLVSATLGFVISYLLGPWVNFLERRDVNRVFATTSTFVFVGLIVVATSLLVFPMIAVQIDHLKTDLPIYIQELRVFSEKSQRWIENHGASLGPINASTRLEEWVQVWSQALLDDVPRWITNSLTVMMLAPFFAFFMIKDGRRIFRAFFQLAPNPIFEISLSLFHRINEQLGQFVRARLFEAAAVGLVTLIGLLLIQFPYAFVLAAFAALTNLIPYIGPLLGAIPAFAVAFLNGASSLELILLSLVFLVAQIIDAAILMPVMVAKIVNLHPVTVVIAIILGAQLMGVMGMILSIPAASVIKVTFSTLYFHLTDFRHR